MKKLNSNQTISFHLRSSSNAKRSTREAVLPTKSF